MTTGFIDWTEGKICLYIFEKKGSDYILVDTVYSSFEDELNQNSLAPLAKTNIEYIYLSVPLNLLSLREMSFPFSDKNKIKDTISYELEGILLGNISDYSIDHVVTESLESGSKVLAVCIEKTRLKEIINTFSSVGLEPKVITSVDLRLSAGKPENLLEDPAFSEEIRAEAVREELLNPSINLRQKDLAYTGDIERTKKTFRSTAVLVLILLLILGADTTLRFRSLKKEHTLLTKEINTTYRNAFPADTKIVDAVRQFRGNLNLLMRKKAVLEGIPVLDTLLNIADLKDNNITLHEFTADEDNILIKGTTVSFKDVESFKNTLSSFFIDVKVLDSNASADKKISFTVTMKEKNIHSATNLHEYSQIIKK